MTARKRESKRKVAVIDCETNPFEKCDANGNGVAIRPFIWDIYDGETHFTFETVKDVISFLEDKEWCVYAHNGGRFDYHMPGFLDALRPYASITIINGRLAKFVIGVCEFRDSVNILPIKLSDYKKDDFDYDKMRPENRRKHWKQITEYLLHDTEFLYELVTKFRAEYGDKLTLASAALAYWRDNKGGAVPTMRGTDGKKYYDEVAPYYYGGRVECFAGGIINKGFKLIDINSAYPYAMLHQHPFSTDLDWTGEVAPKAEIRTASLYHIQCKSFGALPHRDKESKKLVYPHGEGEFTVTGWELLAGVETGTVRDVRVIKRGDFSELGNFAKYINYFYDIKRGCIDKHSWEYISAKLFMNSLYGKFGANPEKYGEFIVCRKDEIEAWEEEDYEEVGVLGNWWVMKRKLYDYQQTYYNLATAASITGFVRAYLWRHLCAIRKSGGVHLYCDTDSIAFIPGRSCRRIVIGKELGEWTDEGDFIQAAIAGKKLYAFQYKTAKTSKDGKTVTHKIGCKGGKLTAAEICRVASGEIVKYLPDVPTFSYDKPAVYVPRDFRATLSL